MRSDLCYRLHQRGHFGPLMDDVRAERFHQRRVSPGMWLTFLAFMSAWQCRRRLSPYDGSQYQDAVIPTHNVNKHHATKAIRRATRFCLVAPVEHVVL